MADELLSQEEIEALLKGIGAGASKAKEIEDLKEIAHIYAQALSNVLQLLSGEEVVVDVKESDFYDQKGLAEKFQSHNVMLYLVEYDVFEGWIQAFLMEEKMALLLADIMMGGDGAELPAEMNDLYLSAAQEGVSQITGAAVSEMVNLLRGRRIGIKNTSCAMKSGEWIPFDALASDEKVWAFSMEADIKGVGKLSMWSLMPQKIALLLMDEIKKTVTLQPGMEEKAQQKPQQAKVASEPVEKTHMRQTVRDSGALKQESRVVEARPAEFVPLDASTSQREDVEPQNFDLIMDVPVRITVRLGQAFKTIGEILSLSPGSVIELDKMAGDPVDILVNGKLIARGEVVVIDENFGVRITEIVNRSERVKSLR
ncbi:flagellar motor switch protein FliN/FliY [Acetomicrobium flavidum]|uniref:Flagellar motor switch protein FliN/FliY n=1 Tax=Acetomicrobium flavidum TaxID=49896 RepID=A0ABY1JCG1_9BACT|nr:flagellar motor switch protein FliN/FliY [Acetomicrobium flavidum]